MNNIIHILHHSTRAAAMLLVALLTATQTAWAQGNNTAPVSYIDSDGTTKECSDYTLLESVDVSQQYVAGGWYVAQGNINITSGIIIAGDMHLILADGATVNIGSESDRIAYSCISKSNEPCSLTIYGQTGQTGTLNAYNKPQQAVDVFFSTINVNSYTQHGGIVNLNADDSNAKKTDTGTIKGTTTITGGTLNASGAATAIFGDFNMTDGNVTLNGYDTTVSGGNLIVSGCNVTVSGGTLNATGKNVIDGVLSMTGGNVTLNASADDGICYAINSTATIDGGTLTVNDNGIGGLTTINGGTVTITGDYGVLRKGAIIRGGDINVEVIQTFDDPIIISGGNVNVVQGIVGNVALSWSAPTDCFKTSLIFGNITITDGQSFTDGSGNTYSGTLSADDLNAIKNVTLYPYIKDVSLAANPVQDNYWTTFYCGHTGYAINDDVNAMAYTATCSSDELTLHKLGKVIPKGTAVIIVGESASIGMTASTAEAEYSVGNDLRGVDARTLKSTLGSGTCYVMGKVDGVFGFFPYAADYMPARKAYLLVSDNSAQTREFKMVFEDDADRVASPIGETEGGTAIYNLAGQRLDKIQKGINIINGKKILK